MHKSLRLFFLSPKSRELIFIQADKYGSDLWDDAWDSGLRELSLSIRPREHHTESNFLNEMSRITSSSRLVTLRCLSDKIFIKWTQYVAWHRLIVLSPTICCDIFLRRTVRRSKWLLAWILSSIKLTVISWFVKNWEVDRKNREKSQSTSLADSREGKEFGDSMQISLAFELNTRKICWTENLPRPRQKLTSALHEPRTKYVLILDLESRSLHRLRCAWNAYTNIFPPLSLWNTTIMILESEFAYLAPPLYAQPRVEALRRSSMWCNVRKMRSQMMEKTESREQTGIHKTSWLWGEHALRGKAVRSFPLEFQLSR